jgi:hypothetical protein
VLIFTRITSQLTKVSTYILEMLTLINTRDCKSNNDVINVPSMYKQGGDASNKNGNPDDNQRRQDKEEKQI